ncbi:hypothetical protein DYB36_004430 [Aphanomyces astaci]|uniref:FAD-binding domain-containing protein n=1 Tax=Aphanomyces astaci TaxID=112090 RepID=A0A397APZ5_APHAT|nr:hypothetical protein DYB36_004430 [Aphanomyces astaci]
MLLQHVRRQSTSSRVLIAGGGPVGLTLGILLQHVYNVPVDIVERQMQPTQHPQAHFMNLRTMEILRTHMPVLHDRILDATAPPQQSLSSTQPVHFPQHKFETLLNEYAAECGVHVRRGDELIDLRVSTARHAVDVTLRSEKRQYEYVVGADGAHSKVRSLLQIPMEGPPPLQSLVNVHFTSHEVLSLLIAHDLANGEWVFQIPVFPLRDQPPQANFPPDRCIDLIRAAAGAPSLDVALHSVGAWKMTAQVAAQYADPNHQVFVVGDAAHQFPPAGGFGMNTGIQDAHNLAWKLAHHIHNPPSPINSSMSWLPTYGVERKAIASAMTRLSLRNFERTLRVPTALHVSAKALDTVSHTRLFQWLPQALQSSVVTTALAAGTAHLATLDSAATSSMGRHLKRRVHEIVSSRQALGMLFYNADIGYSYSTNASSLDTSDTALNQAHRFHVPSSRPLDDSIADSKGLCDKVDLVFTPQLQEGCRIPHQWLRKLHDDPTMHPPTNLWSTLDLPQRVLLTTPKNSGPNFVLVVQPATYAHLAATDGALPSYVAIVVLHPNNNMATPVDKNHPTLGHDAYVYTEATAVTAAAAILVRPDGHVARIWSQATDVSPASVHTAMSSGV